MEVESSFGRNKERHVHLYKKRLLALINENKHTV